MTFMQESKYDKCQTFSATDSKETCKQIATMIATNVTRKLGGKYSEQSK